MSCYMLAYCSPSDEMKVVLASSRFEIIYLVAQAGQTLLEHVGLQFLFLIISTTRTLKLDKRASKYAPKANRQ